MSILTSFVVRPIPYWQKTRTKLIRSNPGKQEQNPSRTYKGWSSPNPNGSRFDWDSPNKKLVKTYILVCYCKCCNLIGYATRCLFVNIYPIAASNATRPSFSQENNTYSSFFETMWRNNEHKFVFTKTIRLLSLYFYEAIVNSGIAIVKYHLGNFQLII